MITGTPQLREWPEITLSCHHRSAWLVSYSIRICLQETFKKEGLGYTMDGLTGNTLNSHRLIAYAGEQGFDTQDRLVEELFKAYFTQAILFLWPASVLHLQSAQPAMHAAPAPQICRIRCEESFQFRLSQSWLNEAGQQFEMAEHGHPGCVYHALVRVPAGE